MNYINKNYEESLEECRNEIETLPFNLREELKG